MIFCKKFHKNRFQLKVCDFMLKNFLGVTCTFIAYGHEVGINIISVFKYLFSKMILIPQKNSVRKGSIARDQIIQVAYCVGAMIVSFDKAL